jgi:hypothetical protein
MSKSWPTVVLGEALTKSEEWIRAVFGHLLAKDKADLRALCPAPAPRRQ